MGTRSYITITVQCGYMSYTSPRTDVILGSSLALFSVQSWLAPRGDRDTNYVPATWSYTVTERVPRQPHGTSWCGLE